MRIIILVFGLFIINATIWAENIPYTLEDRDKLTRVETKLDEMDKRFSEKFEQADKRLERIENRMERLESVMMWGFGLLFTTMIGLVGFVLWDRRSALAPAIRKNKELDEREAKIEQALKDNELAEILKKVGLL